MADKLTLSVDELAERMGISRPRAYELVHVEGFPSIRFGRRIIIPIEQLHQWLKEQSEAVIL